jgi:hypothetical protein
MAYPRKFHVIECQTHKFVMLAMSLLGEHLLVRVLLELRESEVASPLQDSRLCHQQLADQPGYQDSANPPLAVHEEVPAPAWVPHV